MIAMLSCEYYSLLLNHEQYFQTFQGPTTYFWFRQMDFGWPSRHRNFRRATASASKFQISMDTDIGTELFASYEGDFNLIIADISSKLQGLQDQDGEARKSAIRAAERAAEEAEEIVPAIQFKVNM
jgi:Vesicle transport v-SNARE protein N-terminus